MKLSKNLSNEKAGEIVSNITFLLSLDRMEQEDFMLIRIRRHDNKCKETQVAVSELIITIVFCIQHIMRINLIIASAQTGRTHFVSRA